MPLGMSNTSFRETPGRSEFAGITERWTERELGERAAIYWGRGKIVLQCRAGRGEEGRV